MALPVLARTHQFQVNQNIAGQGTLIVQNQNLMWALVQSMIGAGVWTDKDGNTVTVAGAATIVHSNNFGSAAALTWQNDGVAHSWAVLFFAAAGVYMLINLAGGGTSSDTATIKISRTDFTTAAGGTDGTTTTAPTALNSDTRVNASGWGACGTTATATVLHAIISTDGKSNSFVMCRTSFTVAEIWVDEIGNAPGGLTNKKAVRVACGSTVAPSSDVVSFSNTNSTSATTGRIVGWANAGTVVQITPTAPHNGSNALPAAYATIGDVSTGYPFFAIPLSSLTAGTSDGNMGIMVDRWWGITAEVTGKAYPGDEVAVGLQRQFAKLGSTIYPWRKTNVQTS